MPDREVARGRLGEVQDFVNTADLSEAVDAFDSPRGLQDWLVERKLLSSEVGRGNEDLRKALAVREAIRGLTLANNGGPVYPVDLATLNRAASESRLRVRFQSDGSARLEPEAEGIDGVLGRIVASVQAAMVTGEWARLKACPRHDCKWAFYDASKNHSGTWCTMRTCGNRTKVERYRARKRGHA